MQKQPSYCILLLVLISVSISTMPSLEASDLKRPNVVLLLADDLGWTGLRCFGSDFYETPNLDRLAQQGMKFTNAYSACTVCSPTRASIMTGMYPARLHLTDFIAGQNRPWAKLKIPEWTKYLDGDYVTLAEALRDEGYHTAHVGKWHLDHPSSRGKDFGPTAHGFQVTHQKPPGTRGYFLSDKTDSSQPDSDNYLTDYLTDKAIEVIDAQHRQPFFLYFAYHTPHTPIQGRPDLVEYFQARSNPDALHNNSNYAAMVKSLDMSVGRILERLKEEALIDNTLIVFISDNGGLTQRYGKHDHFTENLPLRRGKGSAYEGGVRVPCIIRWTGVTQPGSSCDEPIMTTDLYPTILKATRTIGSVNHSRHVDGRDLTALLKDSTTSLQRDLFWHYPHYHAGGDGPYSAIRSGDWRLIHFHEDDSLRLYNLQADLGEQTDLADKLPERRDELYRRLRQWRSKVSAQMPSPNPEYDPARETKLQRQAKAKN